eukprot:TRINITY_DN15974_c0_g1_i1.p1 TRINITY_DN15974_c0_g1~~TRINITY_DN15974_c0_g1_i1.p1  ORF type:complete len:180 (+),score=38.87 TRINITY_DN15974_c0_g1_i1:50-589(+)
MGKRRQRGEGGRSVGDERSQWLGKAERGDLDRELKRKQEQEEEAGIALVDKTGEVESVAMSWQAVLVHGKPVIVDTSSGIDMDIFINNLCLTAGEGGYACIAVKYTPSGTKTPKTISICSLTTESPHAALQCMRFHSDDNLQLILHATGPDPETFRVTVSGEQVMRLNEDQIAALLLDG